MADRDRLARDGDAMLGRPAMFAMCALAIGFGVVIVGGYRLGWSWTGFSDNGTIWDWLQLLVLPVVLTLWYRTRGSLRIEWRGGAVALALAALVLIVGGYGYDWRFTGFPGKTLWAWLDPLVLPLALTLLPISLESSWGRFREARRAHRRRHRARAARRHGVCVRLALDGVPRQHVLGLAHLLLVPFLLPAAVTWLSARARETEVRDSPAT